MNTHIRNESRGDIEAIEKVIIEAFLNAPHTDHTEHHIVRQLRKAGALSISLVTELDAKIVGHVALSPVTLSDETKDWFGLGPISVLPSHQKSGIGSQLMLSALELLKHGGAAGCVLLGDPAFYSRFGFSPQPSLVLPEVPPEYFQVIRFAGTMPCGTVTYHDAFKAKS